MKRLKEEGRRIVALALTIGGWCGASVIVVWDAATFDPKHGDFAPAWVVVAVIMLVGVAIAASTALGRLRSIDVLTRVFNAGREAGSEDDGDNPDD